MVETKTAHPALATRAGARRRRLLEALAGRPQGVDGASAVASLVGLPLSAVHADLSALRVASLIQSVRVKRTTNVFRLLPAGYEALGLPVPEDSPAPEPERERAAALLGVRGLRRLAVLRLLAEKPYPSYEALAEAAGRPVSAVKAAFGCLRLSGLASASGKGSEFVMQATERGRKIAGAYTAAPALRCPEARRLLEALGRAAIPCPDLYQRAGLSRVIGRDRLLALQHYGYVLVTDDPVHANRTIAKATSAGLSALAKVRSAEQSLAESEAEAEAVSGGGPLN